jgi:hypothetical protein
MYPARRAEEGQCPAPATINAQLWMILVYNSLALRRQCIFGDVHARIVFTAIPRLGVRSSNLLGCVTFGTELGTPKPAVFALDAATSVRKSTLLAPMMRTSFVSTSDLRHDGSDLAHGKPRSLGSKGAGPLEDGQGRKPAEPVAQSASLDGPPAVRQQARFQAIMASPGDEVQESTMMQRLAQNRRLQARNALRCKLLILLRSSAARPRRRLRLLSCNPSVGCLRRVNRALSFAKMRSDKTARSIKAALGFRLIAALVRTFGNWMAQYVRQIDRSQAAIAATAVLIVCRSNTGDKRMGFSVRRRQCPVSWIADNQADMAISTRMTQWGHCVLGWPRLSFA